MLFTVTGAPRLIQDCDSDSNQVRKRTLALQSVQTMNQKIQIQFGGWEKAGDASPAPNNVVSATQPDTLDKDFLF